MWLKFNKTGKVKWPTTGWEKLFAIYITDKGLISHIKQQKRKQERCVPWMPLKNGTVHMKRNRTVSQPFGKMFNLIHKKRNAN